MRTKVVTLQKVVWDSLKINSIVQGDKGRKIKANPLHDTRRQDHVAERTQMQAHQAQICILELVVEILYASVFPSVDEEGERRSEHAFVRSY